MTDSLYERYKDALREGHVAALRDRPADAVVAYRKAARLAPDRPLPLVSLGNVHLKAGDTTEAIAAFNEALGRAPRDEAALTGRANALVQAGRRVEAAEALDVLAGVLQSTGRLAEALDTARRALDQAESKERRRHVEELSRELGSGPAEAEAGGAIARAFRALAGRRAGPTPEAPAGEGLTTAARVADGSPLPSPEAEAGEAAMVAEPEPEPEPEPDIVLLTAEAEDAIDVGDTATARDRLLAAARIHTSAGRLSAGLDACYRALAFAPANPDLHLAMVDLYLARGWRGPAADKIVLLARLIDLEGDISARERLCTMVAERFPGDARLAELCA